MFTEIKSQAKAKRKSQSELNPKLVKHADLSLGYNNKKLNK